MSKKWDWIIEGTSKFTYRKYIEANDIEREGRGLIVAKPRTHEGDLSAKVTLVGDMYG